MEPGARRPVRASPAWYSTLFCAAAKFLTIDPVAVKALKFVVSLVDPEEGHIAGAGSKRALHNYVTSVNLLALHAADADKRYAAIVAAAAGYLKKLQWDEGEGKKPADAIYGGAGYGGRSRPDLSNTQFFLDALVAAGTPKDDPAFQKALIYVSRCQNLSGNTTTSRGPVKSTTAASSTARRSGRRDAASAEAWAVRGRAMAA